jgi:hypothetical protein
MSFITKLNAVVEALRANPSIYVAHYAVLPPDAEAIAEVEKEIGYQLDSSIADFYRECGGVQLLWLNKANEDFETKKAHIAEEIAVQPILDFNMFAGELGLYHTSSITADELITDGVIMIPPVNMSFLDQEYNDNSDEYGEYQYIFDQYDVVKKTDTLKIRRFDMFMPAVNIAFVLDGSAYPVMLTTCDKYEYDDSAVIYFKEYLNLLLESKGNIKRVDLLSSKNRGKVITDEAIEAFKEQL